MSYLNGLDNLWPTLKYASSFLTMLQQGKLVKNVYQKVTSPSFYSKDELVEAFLANQVNYDDHVKIQGILIDFAHLYKPKSYINALDKNLLPDKPYNDGQRTLVMHTGMYEIKS